MHITGRREAGEEKGKVLSCQVQELSRVSQPPGPWHTSPIIVSFLLSSERTSQSDSVLFRQTHPGTQVGEKERDDLLTFTR